MTENVDAATIRVKVKVDTADVEPEIDGVKGKMRGLGSETGQATGKFKMFSTVLSKMGGPIGKFGSGLKSMKGGFAGATAGAQGLRGAMTSLMASMGPLLIVMIAVAAAMKAIKFLGASVDAAADAQKTRRYFSAVFGESTAFAQKKVEELARAYKLNVTEMMQTTAQFAQLYRSAGMGAEKAAEMSTRLVQLGHDIAATNASISQEDAMAAMKGIAQGNTRALKQLGIAMSDVDVKNYAMQNGILRSGESFTTAKKQQALYQISLEKLGNTQGNYAKNANTLENANNNLNAATGDLKETIGSLLLPVVTAIKNAFAEWVKWQTLIIKFIIDFYKALWNLLRPALDVIRKGLDAIIGAFRWLIDTIKGFLGIRQEVAKTSDDVQTAAGDMGDSIEEFGNVVEDAMGLAGFDKLTTLGSMDLGDQWDEFADSVFYAGEAMGDLTVQTNMFETAVNVVRRALKLDEAWNALKGFGTSTWNAIKGAGEAAWNFIAEIGGKAWEGLQQVANFYFGLAGKVWEAIKNIGGAVWNFIAEIGGKAWEAIGSIAGSIWDGIMSAFNIAGGAWDIFKDLAGSAWSQIGNIAGTVWNSITNIAGSAWDGIKSIFTSVWDNIVGVISGASPWEAMKNIAGTVFNAIKGFAGSIWDGFSDIMGSVFGEAWDKVVGFLAEIGTRIKDTILGVFGGIIDAAVSLLTGFFDGIIGGLRGITEKLGDFFGGVWGGIMDFFGGVWGGITDFAGDVWGGIKGFIGLAEGGAAMPGKPGLVMVGDNQLEPEIVAPQSMVAEAVADALRNVGAGEGVNPAAGEIVWNVTLELDGAVLARKQARFNAREMLRQGGGSIIS